MEIEVKGIEEIQKSLKKLEKKTGNLAPTLKAIGEMIRTKIDESFEKEASPFGEKWKPISATTAFNYAGGKKKAFKKGGRSLKKSFIKKYGAHGDKRILVESENLKDSWGVKADNKSVTVESYAKARGFPYGLTHQFGSVKRGIPARPFLPVDDKGNLESTLQKDILEKIEDDLLKGD